MGSTNYTQTFIRIAEDCPVDEAEVPVARAKGPTVASLEYDLIAGRPYELNSDDVLFEVHAIRQGLADSDREAARSAYFAKSQACLRASPLGKRYGWGIHHDGESRIALVGVGTDDYDRLAEDPAVLQVTAMRSRRS